MSRPWDLAAPHPGFLIPGFQIEGWRFHPRQKTALDRPTIDSIKISAFRLSLSIKSPNSQNGSFWGGEFAERMEMLSAQLGFSNHAGAGAANALGAR
jgi:hypothetical protein